jgi:lipoate-protein ligase A
VRPARSGIIGAMALPLFSFVTVHEHALAAGCEQEAAWMAHTAHTGRAVAHLWQSVPSLVVPASYRREQHFSAVCAQWGSTGMPVQVRGSGGGLVPQGPGLLNLSLVWRSAAAALTETEPIYRALCSGLAQALAALGVQALPQAVQGSFCDGRFNLAVGGRKLAGTAQTWRRIDGTMVVLAHAVLLVDADPEALTQRCNALEAALGTGRRYRSECLTSLAAERRRAGLAPPQCRGGLVAEAASAIARQFARAVLPPGA